MTKHAKRARNMYSTVCAQWTSGDQIVLKYSGADCLKCLDIGVGEGSRSAGLRKAWVGSYASRADTTQKIKTSKPKLRVNDIVKCKKCGTTDVYAGFLEVECNRGCR